MQQQIEKGQIYVLKIESKVPRTKESEKIRIEKYEKQIETEHKIKGVWSIVVRDESGDWIKPSNGKPYLFSQQIESHYNLEFEPMKQKKSRLDDVED